MEIKLLPLLWGLLLLPFLGGAQDVDSLRIRGETLHEEGRFEEAKEYYEKAITGYKQRQDTVSWLQTGMYQAEVYAYLGEYEKAFDQFGKLLAVDHPFNDASFKARVHISLGWARQRRGERKRVLEHYRKALDFAKQEQDSLLLGYLYSNMGLAVGKREAIRYFKKSLPIFEGIDNQRGIAISLDEIGDIYRDYGLYEEALEYYRRSLAIRWELNNVNLLANGYESIGVLQDNRGNFRQALVSYQKALQYSRETGSMVMVGSILDDIGMLYYKLAEYEKAVGYFREQLELARETNDPSGIATALSNLGRAHWRMGKTEKAETLFERSLKYARNVEEVDYLIRSYRHLALLANEEKRYKKAEDYILKALSLAETMDHPQTQRVVHQLYGVIQLNQDNYPRAVQQFREALFYAQTSSEEDRIYPLMNMTLAHEKMDSDSVLYYGNKVIEGIEKHRIQAGTLSRQRSSYFERFSDFYIKMADWTLEYENDRGKAFQLLESSKARTLSENLNRPFQDDNRVLPEEVRLKRGSFQIRIDSLYNRLKTENTKQQRERIRREIRDAELEYEALENRLQQQFPEYKKIIPPDPVSLSKARRLCDENTAIILYAVSANRLIAYFIQEEGVESHRIKGEDGEVDLREKLTGQVRDFREAIISKAGREELEFRSDKLYRSLLKPFKSKLQTVSKLLIIPDGPLAHLPFEALIQQGNYLLEQYGIKYAPSLTAYTLLEQGSAPPDKQLLALAGSDVSGSLESNLRKDSGVTYSMLPSTLIEIDSVSSHFDDTTVLREQIGEERLKKYLSSPYRYIHLATHGVVDEKNPYQSGLVLSDAGQVSASSREDGMLKASEIFELNLQSEMVVLSACNSGLGKIVRGEGMLGLQRAFLQAGVPSVVISLWSVYDRSTALLMNEFYSRLILSENQWDSWYVKALEWVGWEQNSPFGEKAKALREAKLSLIDHPRYNHPVYWAPFILVGR